MPNRVALLAQYVAERTIWQDCVVILRTLVLIVRSSQTPSS